MSTYSPIHTTDVQTRPSEHHAHPDAHESSAGHRSGSHMILMLLTCVAMIGALFLFVGRAEGSLGILPWLIVLLCPALHLFMHRKHGGHA